MKKKKNKNKKKITKEQDVRNSNVSLVIAIVEFLSIVHSFSIHTRKSIRSRARLLWQTEIIQKEKTLRGERESRFSTPNKVQEFMIIDVLLLLCLFRLC